MLYTVGKNLIGLHSGYAGNKYYAPTVYDVVNRTHRQANGSLNDASSNVLIPFADKKGLYLQVHTTYTPNYLYVMKDPRYLATINNLSEPVVKTASKTMKVTYTITEA